MLKPADGGLAFWLSAFFLGAALFNGAWAASAEAENRALRRALDQSNTRRTDPTPCPAAPVRPSPRTPKEK